MKTKLILMAATVLIFQTKNVFAVEKALEAVDKEYQHELICQASTENGEYELKLQWTVENTTSSPNPGLKNVQFAYELKNLADKTVDEGSYENFFNESALLDDSNPEYLGISGQYTLNKRIGSVEKDTNMLLEKNTDGAYSLVSFRNETSETFQDQWRACIHPSRVCGDPVPTYVQDLDFVKSICQIVK